LGCATRSITACRAGPILPAAQISRWIASGGHRVKVVTDGIAMSVRARVAVAITAVGVSRRNPRDSSAPASAASSSATRKTGR
tara:strand:+ start:8552 stop:8800 length:249 start_codon:yes stop_codon:yes gene_type:complete